MISHKKHNITGCFNKIKKNHKPRSSGFAICQNGIVLKYNFIKVFF